MLETISKFKQTLTLLRVTTVSTSPFYTPRTISGDLNIKTIFRELKIKPDKSIKDLKEDDNAMEDGVANRKTASAASKERLKSVEAEEKSN